MLLKLIRRALQRSGTPAELNALALAHHGRGELDKAEEYFRKVALQTPREASAWINLAATLVKQQKYDVAIPVLRELIDLKPDLAEAHLDLGVCSSRLKNNAEAIAHYRNALALKPDLAAAHANLVNTYLDGCQWDDVERWTAEFLEYRQAHPARDWAERVDPYCALTLLPGAVCKEVAVHRAARIERSVGDRAAPAPGARGGARIRLGYVSADFYDHATAQLTFGLYGAHERSRFEVYAYSMGPDDGSRYRRHIERTCDRFVDVRHETEELTARRIRDDGIDVLVDMKGYTANARPRIFACRPAPVQVSYLGYPGTMGARFIDYFISDRVATPPGYEEEFTEQLVYLPDTYQVNDDRQPISPQPVSRSDAGLPANSFVYCSFNVPRKIDRGIFSVWMRVLHRVPESVLWLIRYDPLAETNLRRQAQASGIDPGRLVFSDRQEKSRHLARHQLADVFLDCFVCNAHTGASDALWAGLPLLTCPGRSFASRVAASLLNAAGLPELVSRDLDEYENTAVRLAQEREPLAGYRRRLEQNRANCALFDIGRYVSRLEAAYGTMTDISRSGGAPRSFAVGAVQGAS